MPTQKKLQLGVNGGEYCVLCGEITCNKGTFTPLPGFGYLKKRYVYALCKLCYDKATMEELNKIEDMIYEGESGDGKLNA